LATFNLNYTVKVFLTDLGIEHYIKQYNQDMPIRFQKSFKEIKHLIDKEGYLEIQGYDFLNYFGCLGSSITRYININIEIDSNCLKS
jgi:hypothetical protein